VTASDDTSAAVVLLVDDDHDVLGANARFLRVNGHRVIVAESAPTALARLNEQVVDLVVTDLRLPGIDGIGLARAARELHPFVPILFFSGFARVPDVVEAMKLGAVDFLEKPVEPELMLATVRQLVEQPPGAVLVERHAFASPGDDVSLRRRMRAYERHVIETALRRHDGRVAAVLTELHLNRRTLNDKMAKLGISRLAAREDG